MVWWAAQIECKEVQGEKRYEWRADFFRKNGTSERCWGIEGSREEAVEKLFGFLNEQEEYGRA
jgi:hypothetical protein